jgi:hypothetical protein
MGAGTGGSNQNFGIYISSGNGASWTAANNGLPNQGQTTVNTIICVPRPDSSFLIFAGTISGLYLSRDTAKSWGAAGSGMPTGEIFALDAAPTASGNLVMLAGYHSGLAVSYDTGVSWSQTAITFSGQQTYFPIYQNQAIAHFDTTIYITTNFGICSIRGSGASWTATNTNLNTAGNIYAVFVHGRYLYCGSGTGIWRMRLK